MTNDVRAEQGSPDTPKSFNRLPDKDVPFIFFDLGLTEDEKKSLEEFYIPTDMCYPPCTFLNSFVTKGDPNNVKERLQRCFSVVLNQNDAGLVINAIFKSIESYTSKVQELCNLQGLKLIEGGGFIHTMIIINGFLERDYPYWHVDKSVDNGTNTSTILKEKNYRFVSDFKGKTNTWFFNATDHDFKSFISKDRNDLDLIKELGFPGNADSNKVLHADDFGGTIFDMHHAIHSVPVNVPEETGRLLVIVESTCYEDFM